MFVVGVFAALSFFSGGTLPAQAAVDPNKYVEGTDPAAAVFNPLVVDRIDLSVPQASVDYLNAHTSGAAPGSHGEYQPASMTFTTVTPAKIDVNGNEVSPQTSTTTNRMDVGIRLKGGWGSGGRSLDGKPAFKVKMNYSVKGQKLFGLKKLTLNNMVQDASMLHEAVGYKLFRAAGVPAPRVGYAEVFVNGADLGLHLNLETYDAVSAARLFTSTKHIYEGAYWQDIIPGQAEQMQVDEGLAVNPLDPTTANNTADLTTLANVNNINVYDPSQVNRWFTDVQKYADLNEMLTEWAVERYIAHWDGYSWQIKNNYYVHFDSQGIASILPSGIDQTSGGTLPMMSASSAAVMFTNCMASNACRSYYLGAVNKVRSVAMSLGLQNMVDDVSAALASAVMADPRKESGYDTWQWAVSDARSFHIYRPAAVASETNFNLSSDVHLSYSYPTWKPGDTFTPTITRNGTANPSFAVINNPDVCTINPSTGVVTAVGSGWCRVSARVGATAGWGASLAYFKFLVGSQVAKTTVTQIAPMMFGTTAPVLISTESSATPQVVVSGKCNYIDGNLVANSGTGSCSVVVTVPNDGQFAQTVTTINVALTRAPVTAYDVIASPEFTGRNLPMGGTLALTHKPSKITGPCKTTGLTLKAIAAKGTCIVSWKAWNDANFDYSAQTKRVGLIAGTQTFPTSVIAGGNKTWTGAIQLAKAVNIKTNWGIDATFTSNDACTIFAEGDGTTWAYSQGSAPCIVTLKTPKAFGLKGLVRTWTFTTK